MSKSKEDGPGQVGVRGKQVPKKDAHSGEGLEVIQGEGPGFRQRTLPVSSTTSEVVGALGFRRASSRRQMPRLGLSSEQFRLSSTGKIFPLADLSEGGMGLWIPDQDDRQVFSIGLLLEGTLNVQRQKYPVQARVRYLAADRVGCQFENLEDSASTAIAKFLDPAVLGSQMRPYPSPEVQSTLWYHGPNQTELFLSRRPDGQFHRLSVHVLGNFVQWDETEGLVTGMALLPDQPTEIYGVLRMETLPVDQDEHPDIGKLGIAKTLILSSNLPQDLKAWCIRHMNHVNGAGKENLGQPQ